MSNRDATVKAFSLFKPAPAVQDDGKQTTINNRAAAQTPSPAAELIKQRDAFIEEMVATGKATSYTGAWAIAPTIKPELFA